MDIVKHTAILVPEINGIYGPRLWVSADDTELNSLLRVLSIWGAHTDIRSTGTGYEKCYEFPCGFTSTDIWHKMITRMNILLKEDLL